MFTIITVRRGYFFYSTFAKNNFKFSFLLQCQRSSIEVLNFFLKWGCICRCNRVFVKREILPSRQAVVVQSCLILFSKQQLFPWSFSSWHSSSCHPRFSVTCVYFKLFSYIKPVSMHSCWRVCALYNKHVLNDVSNLHSLTFCWQFSFLLLSLNCKVISSLLGCASRSVVTH